jgi:hypothetical protein
MTENLYDEYLRWAQTLGRLGFWWWREDICRGLNKVHRDWCD